MQKKRKGLEDFYLEKSYSLVKSFDRPLALSLVLILAKHAQYFLLCLQPETAEHIQSIVLNADYLTVIMFF